jgi:hypothetical protein
MEGAGLHLLKQREEFMGGPRIAPARKEEPRPQAHGNFQTGSQRRCGEMTQTHQRGRTVGNGLSKPTELVEVLQEFFVEPLLVLQQLADPCHLSLNLVLKGLLGKVHRPPAFCPCTDPLF